MFERFLPGLHHKPTEPQATAQIDPADVLAQEAANFLKNGKKPKDGEVLSVGYTRGELILPATAAK